MLERGKRARAVNPYRLALMTTLGFTDEKQMTAEAVRLAYYRRYMVPYQGPLKTGSHWRDLCLHIQLLDR